MSALTKTALRGTIVLLACVSLALTAPPSTAQSDLTRTEVRELQSMLNDLGYGAGPEDGLYGDKTASAIRAFEQANQMDVSGAADDALLDRVRAAVEDEPASGPATIGTSAPESSDATAQSDDESTEADPQPGPGERAPPADPPDAAATGDSDGAQRDQSAQPSDGSALPSDRTDRSARALVGTRWQVRDETGATFVMTFQANGRLKGPTVSGNWRWRREGGQLVVEFDAGPDLSTRRTAPWPGRSDTMSGTAESAEGTTWTWTAERVGGASPQG